VKVKFKCLLLMDRDALYQKHVVEELTSYEIADLWDTNQKSVCKALKLYGFNRSIAEASKLRRKNKPTLSKYKELNDKEWLSKKYLEEKKSCKEIAKDVGCVEESVLSYLKKYNVPIRKNGEWQKGSILGSKYDCLNDKNWLYQKYITEKRSTNEMVKLSGCRTPNSVRQALIRFNIPVRSVSNGLTCNRDDDFCLTKEVLQVINGSLLGDGYFGKYSKISDKSYPRFEKKNKHRDHVEYVAKILFSANFNKYIRKVTHFSFGKFHKGYVLRSYCQKKLLGLYKKWYPESNNFKKVVPKCINLTPTVLLHWFMDDGNSYRRKGYGRRSRQILITLCTESFVKEDQEWLREQMLEKYDIRSRLAKEKGGTGYRIAIPQSCADTFYDIIGPCPVPSMQYKWK